MALLRFHLQIVFFLTSVAEINIVFSHKHDCHLIKAVKEMYCLFYMAILCCNVLITGIEFNVSTERLNHVRCVDKCGKARNGQPSEKQKIGPNDVLRYYFT